MPTADPRHTFTVTVNDGVNEASDTARVIVGIAIDPDNTDPFVNPQEEEEGLEPYPRIIVLGIPGASASRNPSTGLTFSGYDLDNDRIVDWEAEGRTLFNGMSVSNVFGTTATGGCTVNATSNRISPLGTYEEFGAGAEERRAVVRARCQDEHGAWADWVDFNVTVYQPTTGRIDDADNNEDQQFPRNLYFNAASSSRTTLAQTFDYQYLTSDHGIADRANWPGSIEFFAERFRPDGSAALARIESNSPYLDATLPGDVRDKVLLTPKGSLTQDIAGVQDAVVRLIYTVGNFYDVPVRLWIDRDEASTDSDWSSLERMAPFLEPSTDSDWSSLERMAPFDEPTTDSDWSSLARMTLNRPPVCDPLPDRTVVNGQSTNVDVSSFLSDPDGNSITIEVSESSSRISISNLNASAHSFTINGLSVGTATVTVTPIDSLGARGTVCTFTVTVRTPVTHDCFETIVSMLVMGSGFLPLLDALYNGTHPETGTSDFQNALRAEFRNMDTSIATYASDVSEGYEEITFTGVSEGSFIGEYRLRNSTLAPTFTTPWCVVEIVVTDPTFDSAWSNLAASPTLDSAWSNLLIAPTVDGSWSNLVESVTRDSEWSNLLVSPTRDGTWSNLEASPSLNSEWSPIIGTVVCDGEWSGIVTLVTQDSPWSNLLGPTTVDSAWGNLVVSPTVDSEWSPIIGTVVCDGEWSLIAFKELTRNRLGLVELYWKR